MPVGMKTAANRARTGAAGKFLTFLLGDESYGIAVLKIRQVVPMARIAEVAHMPAHIRGVINLCGKIIPVVDLRLRFGLKHSCGSKCPRIVVVEVDLVSGRRLLMGMIVDAVEEIIELLPSDLDPAHARRAWLDADCVLGRVKVNGSVKTLLNVDRVATGDELAALILGRRSASQWTEASSCPAATPQC